MQGYPMLLVPFLKASLPSLTIQVSVRVQLFMKAAEKQSCRLADRNECALPGTSGLDLPKVLPSPFEWRQASAADPAEESHVSPTFRQAAESFRRRAQQRLPGRVLEPLAWRRGGMAAEV